MLVGIEGNVLCVAPISLLCLFDLLGGANTEKHFCYVKAEEENSSFNFRVNKTEMFKRRYSIIKSIFVYNVIEKFSGGTISQATLAM